MTDKMNDKMADKMNDKMADKMKDERAVGGVEAKKAEDEKVETSPEWAPDPKWEGRDMPPGTTDPSDPKDPRHPEHEKYYGSGIDPAILPGGELHPTRPQDPMNPDHDPQPGDVDLEADEEVKK